MFDFHRLACNTLPTLAWASLCLSAAPSTWAQVPRPALALSLEGSAQNLPTITLKAGHHSLKVQVAQTGEQRAVGLMHRRHMPANEGMLFVFNAPDTQCFWMKNTLLPLSAAFLSDNGTVVNIEHMQPQTLVSHCSKESVRYVLEMNKGWFEKHGIKAGSLIEGIALRP
jgi:uncharacterized protein